MDNAIGKQLRPGFAETFAGMLLSPKSTLSTLSSTADDVGIALAAITVALVSAVDGLRLTQGHRPALALLNVPAAVLVGLTAWLCLSGLLALLAVCFKAPEGRGRAIFVTCGWAFAPWILMSPIWCYRSLLGPYFVLFAFIPLLFVVVNQVLAIGQTFSLKPWQALALVFVVPCLWQVVSSIEALEGFYLAFASFFS
jgi:hypothetical protein